MYFYYSRLTGPLAFVPRPERISCFSRFTCTWVCCREEKVNLCAGLFASPMVLSMETFWSFLPAGVMGSAKSGH